MGSAEREYPRTMTDIQLFTSGLFQKDFSKDKSNDVRKE